MMKVVTRQESGELRISESLTVTVLDICGGKVKLGFYSPPANSSATETEDSLSQIHCAGAGYYRFSSGGSRMLVLERTKGKRVAIGRSEQLVVVDVRQAGVTLALCSSGECGSVESGELSPADRRIPVLEA